MTQLKQNLESLTVPFRFITPILVGLLFYCYSGDQTRLHADISDIKVSQDKIWSSISINSRINDSKFSYVYQQCCTGAKSAPPTIGG